MPDLAVVVAQHWGCGPDVATAVAARARVQTYPARQTILSNRRAEALVFVMIEGEARAFVYAFDGRQILVEDYAKGDLFGDVAAFAQSPESPADDVIAHGDVAAANMPTIAFLGLMDQHHCVAMAVARTLTRRLISANRRVVEIASISAPGRVYGELLRLGRSAPDWRLAPLPVISELALSVQTTRETASRAISQLEKRGIVAREAQALKIVAPHRLEELIY
jgi:CRP/FNR family transcriptional regulator, cyclic AMP receptor protein